MPSTLFPSAQDCSGQVFALDTAGAFIEPQPKFLFENLWPLPPDDEQSGSWGVLSLAKISNTLEMKDIWKALKHCDTAIDFGASSGFGEVKTARRGNPE